MELTCWEVDAFVELFKVVVPILSPWDASFESLWGEYIFNGITNLLNINNFLWWCFACSIWTRTQPSTSTALQFTTLLVKLIWLNSMVLLGLIIKYLVLTWTIWHATMVSPPVYLQVRFPVKLIYRTNLQVFATLSPVTGFRQWML